MDEEIFKIIIRKLEDLERRLEILESQETGMISRLNVGGTGSALVIAAGAITISKTMHQIDTEGGAATDNLDTINGGTVGDIIILRSTDSARDPTLRDMVGNLQLAGNFTLTSTGDMIALWYNGSSWVEISRSDNA
jgi:hypothetical protein